MSAAAGTFAVIGRIFVILLLAVLALIALVLLVPVRYRISGEGDSRTGDARGEARAFWLAGAFTVSYAFDRKAAPDGRRGIRFTVFGFHPGERRRKRREEEAAHRKQVKKEKLDRLKTEDPERYEKLKREAEARREAREAENTRRAEEETSRRNAEKEALKKAKDHRERLLIRARQSLGVTGRIFRALWSAVRDGFWTVYDLLLKLCFLPAEISAGLGRFFSGAAGAVGKAAGILDVITDPRTEGALRTLLDKLKRLLHHLRPREASGEIRFGCGDPAASGEVLAALSVFYPLTAGRIAVCPDFDGTYAAGRLRLAGRVVLICPLTLAVSALISRDVRYLVRLLRKSGKGGAGEITETVKEEEDG